MRGAELKMQNISLDEAVNRFLNYQFPKSVTPDGGLKIDRSYTEKYGMPTGTNLLDSNQAREMLAHVLKLSAE
jgi:hypothetical protein